MVADLARAVRKLFPKRGAYDGNMRMASVLGFVLVFWYLRTHRAKAFDPRRPVAHRKAALDQWRRFCLSLLNAMLDDSEDARIFPSQKWESPHDPFPTDGAFI